MLSATFGGGFTAQNRQSTTWFLRFASARELVAGALKLLPDRVLENCEEPQIVRYEMGDYFNWHEDALPMEEIKSNAANGGVAQDACAYAPPTASSRCAHAERLVFANGGFCAQPCAPEIRETDEAYALDSQQVNGWRLCSCI